MASSRIAKTPVRRSGRGRRKGSQGQPARDGRALAPGVILDHLDEAVYVLRIGDGDDPLRMRVELVRGQAEKISGCAPKEFQKDPGLWLGLLHPEDVAGVLESTLRVLASRQPGTREYRLRHRATGEYRWVEDRVAPVVNGSGAVARLVGTARDITGRKKVEETLRESQGTFRALVDAMDDIVFVLDRAQRHVGVYGRWLQREGFTPDFFLGRTAREVLGPVAAAPHEAANLRALAGESVVYEWQAEGPHGTRHFQTSLSPLRDARGALVGIVGLGREITESKRVEQALHGRAKQQAVVAELGQRALAGRDPDTLMTEAVTAVAETLGVEHCKVLELLPGAEALLLRCGVGWREGLVGRANVSAGASSQAGYTLLSAGPVIVEDLATETRFSAPPLLTEHGVVSGVSVAIPGLGRPFGVLGAHTRRRRGFSLDDAHFLQAVANVLAIALIRGDAENARSQFLDRLMKAQDEERRWIAHELHDEAGQSLASLLAGLRSVQEAPSLEAARSRAGELRPILADTLDELGRLARGLHPSVLDDIGLVPAVERYCHDHLGLRGIGVHIETTGLGPARLPLAIETNLYRIVQEGVTNALKHAGAKAVHIALGREGTTVELRLRDDGPGFDVDTALRTAPRSGRLGLLGVRERVALFGGSFAIESAPGKGTELVVRLPVTAPERAR